MRALWVVAALVALVVHSSQGFMPFFGSYREASQNYYGMYTSFTVSKMIYIMNCSVFVQFYHSGANKSNAILKSSLPSCVCVSFLMAVTVLDVLAKVMVQMFCLM